MPIRSVLFSAGWTVLKQNSECAQRDTRCSKFKPFMNVCIKGEPRAVRYMWTVLGIPRCLPSLRKITLTENQTLFEEWESEERKKQYVVDTIPDLEPPMSLMVPKLGKHVPSVARERWKRSGAVTPVPIVMRS